MRILRTGAAALTLCFAVFAMCAQGASAQSTFDVSVELVTPTPTCTASIADVAFPQLDAGSTVTASLAIGFDMSFDCTGPVSSATATFDGGQHPNMGVRQLNGPTGGKILYGLAIQGPLGSVIHLDANEQISLSLPAGPSTNTLFALMGNQSLPSDAGLYSDQVTVTFTF